jgi:hypothetical protein
MEETIRAWRYLRPSGRADSGTIAYLGHLWTSTCQYASYSDPWVMKLKAELITKRVWCEYVRQAKLIWINEVIAGAATDTIRIITTTKQLYQDEAMLLIAWLQGYAPQPDGAKWDDATRDQALKERRKWLANHLWMVKPVVEDRLTALRQGRESSAVENASGGTPMDATVALQDLSL